MSLSYYGRVVTNDEDKKWVVVLDYNTYVFDGKEEAELFSKMFNTLVRGKLTSKWITRSEWASKMGNEFDGVEGEFHTGVVYKHEFRTGNIEEEISENGKPRVREFKVLSEQDLFSRVTWEKETKCDGVLRADGGECGCCNTYDGHGEPPPDWQDYVDNGQPKHICDVCQKKEMKVETHRVVKCVIKD